MRGKRLIALALLAVIAATCVSCGKKDTAKENEAITATIPATYPIETDVTLRWWQTSAVKEGDQFAKYLEEATGVKVEWEFPADSSSSATAFNLMIASDDMPDIIQAGWANSYGGPDSNIEKNVITDLTPYMEADMMPNFKAYLDAHPELARDVKSAEGRYFFFPQLLGHEKLASFRTWFIREDLLKKANMEAPETLEDWDKMLRAFKDMGLSTPLMCKFTGWQFRDDSPFMACFNVPGDFYHDGDTVKYGFIEEAFGDWVKQMATWYADGILDKDFLNETNEHWSAEILNGNNGAFFGSIGGNLGTYLDALGDDREINYIPVAPPSAKKGEEAMWSSKDKLVKAVGAAVSSTTKNKELAIRLLDYGYSEEGQKLWNFGKEGVSYEMKENAEGRVIPTYTDIIMDASKRNGLTQGEAMGLHTRTGMPISVQSIDYLMQNYRHPEQLAAIDLAYKSRKLDYVLPTGFCTSDEEKQIADIVTPMNTYREETISKIIAGKLPIEKLDEYFAQMKTLGAEKAIEIYQTAYDRYMQNNK